MTKKEVCKIIGFLAVLLMALYGWLADLLFAICGDLMIMRISTTVSRILWM